MQYYRYLNEKHLIVATLERRVLRSHAGEIVKVFVFEQN
jgi:hypothetical protein